MADQLNSLAVADFYNGAIMDEGKTKKEGRPIYDDVVMIRIRWAGNTKSELHAPANDRSDRFNLLPDRSKLWLKWKDAFPKEWEAFEKGQSAGGSGTPIAELPFLTEARRLELRAVNIFTAEQIIALDGPGLAKMGMGARDLQSQVKAFMERAAGVAVDAKHAADKADMQRQMDDLKELVAKLSVGGSGDKPASGKGKGKAAAVVEKAPAASTDPTFLYFNEMGDDDLRNWLKDADPATALPPAGASHADLVKAAIDTNERLKAAAAKAAA